MALKEGLEGVLQWIADRLGIWLIARRKTVLVILSAVTLSLCFVARDIVIKGDFSRSIPTKHPYSEVYSKFAGDFGSGNKIVAALVVNDEGEDIFTINHLRSIDELTKEFTTFKGFNPSSVRSLFAPSTFFVNVTSEGFEGGRIVPDQFQYKPDEIKKLKRNLLRSSEVGRLVSTDFRAALISAEIPVGLEVNYVELGRRLEELRDKYSKNGATLHVIGYVPFISEVTAGMADVLVFFAIAVVLISLLLFAYSRSVLITVIAIVAASAAVVWQLGIVALFGYSLDPLSILVPFLILSIGVSHAVQMVNAWQIGIDKGLGGRDAAVFAFTRMFVPGTTALLANAVGFAVIMVIPIPMIHDLGIAASIGVASMVITNKFMLPPMLSMLRGQPRHRKEPGTINSSVAIYSRGVNALGVLTSRKIAPYIVGFAVVATGVSFVVRQKLVVGDASFGAPELRQDSKYNRDAEIISNKFQVGLDEFVVIVEGRERGCTWFPMLYVADRLEREIGALVSVIGHDSLGRQVRVRSVANAEGNWRFYDIPKGVVEIGASMRGLEVIHGYFNNECSAIPVRFFLRDHKAKTLIEVSEAVRQYSNGTPDHVARIRPAMGSAGLMAATNEEVVAAQHKMLLILYCSVAVLCWLTFMSWRGVLCVLAPLIVVSQFAEAVMVWLDIGLKVSTLPVVALGVGVGVDYGIYLWARVRSYQSMGLALRESYLRGVNDVGSAILFTGLTMALSVGTWVFSPLKLQADMGLLLTYMFLVNMVGALLIIPAIAALLWRDGDPGGAA